MFINSYTHREGRQWNDCGEMIERKRCSLQSRELRRLGRHNKSFDWPEWRISEHRLFHSWVFSQEDRW